MTNFWMRAVFPAGADDGIRNRTIPFLLRSAELVPDLLKKVVLPGFWKKAVLPGVVVGLQAFSAGCADQPANATASQQIKVAVRANPAGYYWLGRRATGLDHDLLEAFVAEYGGVLKIVPTVTVAEALALLESGRVQIAAGALGVTDTLRQRFAVSPSYYQVTQQFVYRHPDTPPAGLGAVAMEDVDVSPHPSHLETLSLAKQKNHAAGDWYLHENTDSHELIKLLDLGVIRYTIVDSSELAASRLFYPYVKIAFDVTSALPVVWLLRRDAPAELVEAVADFFDRIKRGGELARLLDKHQLHAPQLSYAEKLTFLEAAGSQLPKYGDQFRRAAKLYKLNWKLLAAVAYQESRWDPDAVSPTGVKGMMMLTRDTAEQYDIAERADAYASIRGGARHFLAMKERVPAHVPEPERTWLALVAYNSGYGHVMDAMELTARQGGNPASWPDLKKALRLLQQPRWYRNARHGRPRGGDTLLYVRNIRNYQRLIDWLEGDVSTETPRPSRTDTVAPAPL